MQPGSIIECINNTDQMEAHLKRPALNTPYTLRTIIPKGTKIKFPGGYAEFRADCIQVEEITNTPYVFHGVIIESGYYIEHWREITPPIENIEEHINENVKEFPLVPQLV